MPTIRGTKKRMRQSFRRRASNRVQRAALRTAVKKVRQAKTADEAQAAYKTAERMLDRAARKNLIPRNTAARNKRRLHAVIESRKESAD